MIIWYLIKVPSGVWQGISYLTDSSLASLTKYGFGNLANCTVVRKVLYYLPDVGVPNASLVLNLKGKYSARDVEVICNM